MVWLPATKAGTLKIKNDIPGFYSHYQFLSPSYAADLFCHWPLWCCKKKERFDTINHNVTFGVIVYFFFFFPLIKVKYRATLSLVGSDKP